MVDAVSSCSPCLIQLLLRLFLSSLLLLSPLSRAEDAGNSSSGSLNYNSTATLKSNSTKAQMPYPAVSLSLSLGISQELNPNPFIHPNPMLSLSLSLSVSEELKGNPFDFVSLLPQPADQHMRRSQQQQQQRQQQQQQRRQPAEQQQLQVHKEGFSQAETSTAVGRGKCTYTVSIKTSCSSPPVTRDAISLAFGDAYRNEVYAARLDDPASGTFDRCSIDTFRVVGPCGSRTCYLYLRRSGRDGWTPEYAKIFYNLKGDSRAAVTFPYNAPLPDGVWYGFNLCHDARTAARPEATTVQPTKADRKKVDDDQRNSTTQDQDGGGGGGGDGGGGGNDDDDDRGDPTIKVKTKVGGSVKTVIFKI